MNKQDFQRGWRSGLPETPCGSGSKLENTRIQREWIPRMVEKYGIHSLADVGAGDLNWVKHMPLSCDYHAFDLFPRHHDVEELDILHDDLPVADCIMCLWVINHMPKEDAKLACERLMQSQAKYLMVTHKDGLYNFFDCTVLESVDIGNGEIRLLEL